MLTPDAFHRFIAAQKKPVEIIAGLHKPDLAAGALKDAEVTPGKPLRAGGYAEDRANYIADDWRYARRAALVVVRPDGRRRPPHQGSGDGGARVVPAPARSLVERLGPAEQGALVRLRPARHVAGFRHPDRVFN